MNPLHPLPLHLFNQPHHHPALGTPNKKIHVHVFFFMAVLTTKKNRHVQARTWFFFYHPGLRADTSALLWEGNAEFEAGDCKLSEIFLRLYLKTPACAEKLPSTSEIRDSISERMEGR